MTISVNRFYRLAVWLPLLISGVAMLGGWLFGMPIFEALNGIVMALILAGGYGGIPYLLLALWATQWMRGKSEARIRRLALLMPLLMLIAFLLAVVLMGAVEGDILDGLFLTLIGIPYILVLGYGYVGLVFLLRHIAQTRGWISPEHAVAE